MLLVVDVGNSNIVIGVYSGDSLIADWRIRTVRDRTADEHGLLILQMLSHRDITADHITGVAISSVVPTMNEALCQVSRRYFDVEPFLVGSDTDFGIYIDYHPPSDVGADRLVNAVAAKAFYGAPAIVVDLGTATTFDVIAANGDYLGGAIAPGIGISTDALFRAASRLYRVELVAPTACIGKNTIQAMQSGIVFGFTGQVDLLVKKIQQEIGEQARVIATGGLAELIAEQSETIEVVDQMLTLEGLRLLWKRNRGDSA
jgi:type III pantothenate kinase